MRPESEVFDAIRHGHTGPHHEHCWADDETGGWDCEVIIALDAFDEAPRQERERLRALRREHVEPLGDPATNFERGYRMAMLWVAETLLAEPCPVRSSVTEARCVLPEGHPPYRADRFHAYPRPEAAWS